MVALGRLAAPHAGGNPARPELLSRPHCVAAGDPQGPVGTGVPLFFQSPAAGSAPQAGRVSLKSGVPCSLPFERNLAFFLVSHAQMFSVDIWVRQDIKKPKLKITRDAPPKESY